jgi:ATP-binding cassette, subfamily C, bacterial CydD
VVALATLGTSATVVIAWQLSVLVSKIFILGNPIEDIYFQLLAISIAGLVKAVVIWAQELLSSRAAASVKMELRSKLYVAIKLLRSGWLNKQSAAEINLLATTGLDSLDSYFAKYLPQLIYAGLVTPALVILIWLQDVASGVALVATLPLIPVFMILIGWATNKAQQKQLDSLTRLTQHFLEVVRGLTTLRIFGRAELQVKTITSTSDQYRVRTMKVLRITFLSGFALELLSSLAVALIAVSIGLRLVNDEISLLVGLFVLILAPEVYLPVRQVGAQFHAAAEGVTASKKVLDILDLASEVSETKESNNSSDEKLDCDFEAGKLTVITGPSGIGKSTIFRNLLGFDSPDQSQRLHLISWMPQQPSLFSGTVRQNILGLDLSLSEPAVENKKLALAVQLSALDDLQLQDQVGVDASQVSGGQAQRISLARAFYRSLTLQTPYLLLDEPISALDSARATVVISSLKSFAAEGAAVAVISHQEQLIRAADRVIEVADV